MRISVLVLATSLALTVALAGLGSCAQLEVQEATLYVAAPAEVKAGFVPEVQSAALDLPGGLVAASLQAKQAEAALAPTLQPVRGPQEGLAPPKVERYDAQFAGLRAGVPVELSFRTGGLGWVPSTTLRASDGTWRLEVQASITNEALDLTGARLRLMSGYVGGEGMMGAPFENPSDWTSYFQAMVDLGRASGAAEAGGLHLAAEVEAPEMPRGSTRQVPLVSADVVVTRSYRWDTYSRDEYSEAMPTRGERAWALYRFSNTTGRALPEGQVTVSEAGAVVGTGYAAWTPPEEMALVAVSSVQGLTVRRSEESAPQPKTWETQRTVKLRVESSREAGMTVRVVEHRGGRWGYFEEDEETVYQFSQLPEAGEEGVFAWDVDVPARGDAGLTYSYREPMDTTALRVLSFIPDDSPIERNYLVEAPQTQVRRTRGSTLRVCNRNGSVVYRLPMPPGVTRADLIAGLGNSFVVSLAPEADGKPGKYVVAADATAIAGQVPRGGANWNRLTFDLSSFLSETSRAVYFRMDDPEVAEAFITDVEVVRIPEGFESRAPRYATGTGPLSGVAAGASVAAAAETRPLPPPTAAAAEPPALPAPPAQRTVLLSFATGTSQEEEAIYYESGTHVHAGGRAVQAENRLIYAFTIPPDVPAATCVVDAGMMFALLVAPDDGGKPGPYTEELNALKIVGRRLRGLENRLDYTIDLTPYLKGNPSRTVYLAVRPAMQYQGGVVFHIEVAVLDDAERAQMERRQRRLDAFLRADRDRYQLLFYTNGSPGEEPYLYEDGARPPGPTGRGAEGREYLIYRLPLTEKMGGSQIWALVHNTFLVTMALEENGKPGVFREATRGGGNMVLDITPAMIAAGAAYLKFEFSRPDDPGGIVIEEISIRRP